MQKKHYSGLSDSDVLESRQRHGANVLTPPEEESKWKKLGKSLFGDPILVILWVAMLLSMCISCYHLFEGAGVSVLFEPIGILIAILLASLVGFFLELSNEKTFKSLNEVNDDTLVKVIRNNNACEVPRRDIVVGDIVLLDTGEEIPADCELLESMSLLVNESSLTGELQCVKTVDPAAFKKDATYPSNLILKGTMIIEGNCIAKVLKVGDTTESGKVFIAAQVQEGEQTPLSEKLDWLGDKITLLSYGFAIVIVLGRLIRYAIGQDGYNGFNLSLAMGISVLFAALAFYLLNKKNKTQELDEEVEDEGMSLLQLGAFLLFPILGILTYFGFGTAGVTDWTALISYALNTLMIAVTLIVVAVPEGLPMSVTLSLAFSMRKLMNEKTLPRTMHACETMGATSVICTDKTGTLTQNQMQIYNTEFTHLKSTDFNVDDLIKEAISTNTTAHLDLTDESKIKTLGNPTEGALLLWLKSNYSSDYLKIREQSALLERLPFSTERKYMASVVESKVLNQKVLFVKGAPEIIMSMCSIDKKDAKTVDARLLHYQDKAMRTLGFAFLPINDGQKAFNDGKLHVSDLTFMGIAAISDPIRNEVPAAIKECIDAGIHVKIVTGDTPGTAKEIGRQVGLWEESDSDKFHMTGPEFASMSDKELQSRVADLKILSRARPNDKERLVSLLKRQDYVVAVTGDGTNDAPALNAAHVGLSMGDGTAVAKEASDMTIMDNSFSTISNAVMWGRSLYKNIQRFIMFQMTINVVACFIVLVGAFLGTESPLTVTQMLWVNLIMDTFAALALASLPPMRQVMKEVPRKVSDFIISGPMAKSIFGVGGLFFVFLLSLLIYFQHNDITSLSSLSFSLGEHDGLSTYELSLFFTIFVMLQFWNMFNAKAFMSGKSAFANIAQCKLFILISIVIFVGQIFIVTCGGEMFNVTPLTISDWGIIVGLTSLVLWVGEIIRFIKRLS